MTRAWKIHLIVQVVTIVAILALIVYVTGIAMTPRAKAADRSAELRASVQERFRPGCAMFIAGQPRPPSPQAPGGGVKPAPAEAQKSRNLLGWMMCRNRANWIAAGQPTTAEVERPRITCVTTVTSLAAHTSCR